MLKITNVGACPGGDAFLLMADHKTVLVDSGFSFSAEAMIEKIKKELKGKTLDYILLTHSHYDHASGSAYCRLHWPEVKVVAGVYAAGIFSRPGAISVMREMNANAALEYGMLGYDDKLDLLHVDMAVKEGDTIDLGGLTLCVLDAPGHTKCSVAFYIPQERMLVSCETLGVYAGKDKVAPCYLVGYEMSMNFIRRAQRMDIDKILIPHYGVLEGETCRSFVNRALYYNEKLKELILEEYRAGKNYEEILIRYKEEFYTENLQLIQPLKAFELNAKYMIPMILRECGQKEI